MSAWTISGQGTADYEHGVPGELSPYAQWRRFRVAIGSLIIAGTHRTCLLPLHGSPGDDGPFPRTVPNEVFTQCALVWSRLCRPRFSSRQFRAIGDLQPDDTSDDQPQPEHSSDGHRFVEEEGAGDDRSDCSDADPYGVADADVDSSQCQGEEEQGEEEEDQCRD